MAYGKFTYLTNKLDDFVLRAQAFAPAATQYVALLTCTNGLLARSTAYVLNNTVVVNASDGIYHLYKVTTAGTTASGAPAYPGAPNEVITDGTAVLTEQASELQAGTAQVEPTGGGYARASIASSLTAWSGTQGAGTTVASTGTAGTISNNVAITFPTTTAAWAAAPAAVWGFAFYDALTGGNGYYFGPLSSGPIAIGASVTPSFAAAAASVHEQ